MATPRAVHEQLEQVVLPLVEQHKRGTGERGQQELISAARHAKLMRGREKGAPGVRRPQATEMRTEYCHVQYSSTTLFLLVLVRWRIPMWAILYDLGSIPPNSNRRIHTMSVFQLPTESFCIWQFP